MSKNLVVVESPAKARTITKILGADYKVLASMGHVRDLPDRRLGIDVENKFKPEYQVTPDRKKVIAELTKEAAAADHIFLATDPDREGEAIAWHLYELLRHKRKVGEFSRVTFHEITKAAVQDSFKHPGQLNQDLVNSQQARRVVDRLVGYQVSPLLWRRIKTARSAGRVQSVALRLICEREALIVGFKSEEYWLLTAHFSRGDAPETFVAKLAKVDGADLKISTAEQAAGVAGDAERGRYRVHAITTTPKQRRPQPPFITSTLQQAASANLRFGPEQTMRLAQQLYEGVDTGRGPTGLITYMRTDSVNVSKEAQQATRAFIGSQFGAQFVPGTPNTYKSRGTAQEAHEAIRPTDVTLTPAAAAPFLDERQAKLYRLIWERFVASQMAPAKLEQTTIEINNPAGASQSGASCAHTYLFRLSATRVLFAGFMQVYNLRDVDVKEKGKDGEDDDEPIALPDLTVGDGTTLRHLDKDQKFTEPPPRFSEATLVRELEQNGVGRPSTYASIVNTIQERDYVGKEKGKLFPTELGKQVNTYLVEHLPSLFDVTFTAKMEDELDTIEQGKRDWVGMVGDFYSNLSGWLDTAKSGATPDLPHVARLLAMVPESMPWKPAEKRGKRTYDDSELCSSLRTQVEEGKKLTDRQWQALLNMLIRYQEHVPGLRAAATEMGFAEALTASEERHAATATATGEPDAEALGYCKLFETVKDWAPPQKRGVKTYDDKKFYESLREQVERGRKLSEPQTAALKKLLGKYRGQIPNLDTLVPDLGETAAGAAPAVDAAIIEPLLALGNEITEWAAPSGKGKRTFDDKEFFTSLSAQFTRSRRLTDRQVGALKKMLTKYRTQIADFDTRTASLALPAPGAKREGGRPAAAPPVLTGVVCPRCGTGQLRERRFRGRVFYGCSTYPECGYSTSRLPVAESAEKAE